MSDKYLEALRRFSNAGDLQMTRSVVSSMEQREVELTAEHLQLLLDANLKGRDAAGARAVMARMQSMGVELPAVMRYDLAITSARAGRLADALVELDALHADGVHPEPRHLNELMAIHVRAGRFPAARAVLRRLAADGRAARPEDYAALFADLHNRKAIKDSIAQVELMLEVGAKPTPKQGRDLVSMMAEAGHPDRAATVLDVLWNADVQVDVQVLSEILDAHARGGDAEAVAATVARMAEVGAEPNSFHRNAMLAAQIVSGDVEAAWAMAEQLLAAGRIPTGDNIDALFDLTIGAGNLQRASGVIDWALIIGVPVGPQRVAQAVEGHLQAGDLKVARWLFDEAARCGVPRDRKAARGIVEETVRAGDLDGAHVLLSELLTNGTLTNGRHWGSLLRAMLGAKRVDDVVTMIGELNAANAAPSASDLVKVVHLLLDENKPKPAIEITLGSLNAGAEADATHYGELLWLFAKAGHVDETDAVHSHMVEKKIPVEHRHLKAVAHARGETIPDPEPEPDPEPAVTPAPAAPTEPEASAAPVAPAAVDAAAATGEAAPVAPATDVAPSPEGTADWELLLEEEQAAPDEANDAALVEATLGAPATPVADEPGDGPTGPLGEVAESTAAEEAAGTAADSIADDAPTTVTEPAPESAPAEDASAEDEPTDA